MAAVLNITFDLTSGDHAGDMRLYAADGGDTPVGDYKVYWGVVGPDGVTHKSFPSVPDATFASSSEIFVPIPKYSTGLYIPGDYSIRVLVTDSDTPPTEISAATISVPFQPYNNGENADSHVILTLTADYNCDTGNITATGSVSAPDYDYSTDDDLISVTPEAGTEQAYSESDNQIGTGSALFYHTNADYTVTYSAIIDWAYIVEDTFNVFVTERVSISTILNIQCTLPDLCKIASCLEKEFKRLEAKTCGKGWDTLSEIEKGKFNKAVALARIILLYKNCGNDTKYREFATKFQTLMDCQCGCGDTTGDGPIPYAAPNLFID